MTLHTALSIARNTPPVDWIAGVMFCAFILAWAVDAGMVRP